MKPDLRAVARVAVAGPGVLAAALAIWLALTLWLPQGAAGIDQMMLPIILFPLIWLALFLHACLDPSLKRSAGVAGGLILVAGSLALLHPAWPT